MARRDPQNAPTRDDVLAGASEIVAGTFGLLRATGSTAPMRHRKARVLIALSSIAGGAGQLRGINALQGVKATGYVFAFTIAIVEKRRRREA